LRIISGKYKGKNLKGFSIDGTRPTMDRVKESLFGIIQNKLINSNCLDLFSGSGSLGLEALSNGANSCVFVDKNKEVIDILKSNLLNIENTIIIKKDYESYLKECNTKFDIIFLDPPYELNLISLSIKLILKNNLLNENGLIICEYEKEKIEFDLEIIKEKKYGSTNIRIYKK